MKLVKRLLGCLVLVFSVIAFSACEATKPFTEFAGATDNVTWVPTYLIGQEGLDIPSTADDDRQVFINFTHRGWGRFLINGRGGVNTFGGSAEITQDGGIIFAPLVSALHVGNYYAYESRFFKALTDANVARLSGNTLSLYSQKGGKETLLLTFKKVEK